MLDSESFTRLFWQKVDATGDCWEWTASRFPNGYGQYRHELAHRVSYRLSVGPLVPGLVIDHLCRNRICVNPAHLEQVTQAENVAKGSLPDIAAKTRKAVSKSRTECKNGHALSAGNEYNPPGQPTWRVCRACKAERQRMKGIAV